MKLGLRCKGHKGLGTFNQEKDLVGAFSVITNLRIELFEALVMVVVYRFMAATIFQYFH